MAAEGATVEEEQEALDLRPAGSGCAAMAAEGAAMEEGNEEDAPLLQLEARILRKRIFKTGQCFLEVLVLEDGEPREAVLVLSAEEDSPERRELLRGGNALSAVGRWEAAKGAGGSRPALPRFRVRSLRLLEAHSEVHGERPFTGAAGETTSTATLPQAAFEEGSGTPVPPVRLLLQCAGPQALRLAIYCQEALPGVICTSASPQPGCPDRALLLRLGEDVEIGAALRRIAADVSVSSVLRRVFPVGPPPDWTLHGAVARLVALARAEGSACTVRVQVFPKYLEQRVVEQMTGEGVRLECVDFSHVASIAYANAAYFVGMAPRSHFCLAAARGLDILATGRPKSPRINRARFKLGEALARSGWEAELTARRPERAVDVGASPGGWSACLASDWGCKEVLAVDPGDLAPELLKANEEAVAKGTSGRIHHLRMRWQEAFEQLKQEGVPVDVLVCDANVPCDQAVDLVEAASSLLAPDAYLVLTFKNCSRTKQEFDQLKARQLQLLGEKCSFVRELQLLANRKLETTVLARLSGSREGAAAQGREEEDRGRLAT